MEDGRGEMWLFTLMPKGGRGVGYGNRKGSLGCEWFRCFEAWLVVGDLRVGRGVSVFVARLSKPTRLDICHPLNEKTIIRIFDSRWKVGCGFVEGDKVI